MAGPGLAREKWTSSGAVEAGREAGDLPAMWPGRVTKAAVSTKDGVDTRRSAAMNPTADPTGTCPPTVVLRADMRAQSAWLRAMARAAGYASLNEFALADAAGFRRLGAEWRRSHPLEADRAA